MEKDISFTQKIKEELAGFPLDNEELEKSLLGAFIRIVGTINIHEKRTILVIKTENAKVAKYLYSIIRTYYKSVVVSFTFKKAMKFYKSTEYLININEPEELIDDLNVDFLEDKIPYSLIDKPSKIKGYLRGLFMANGSCNGPHSTNYHLEIYTSEEALAKNILKLINKVKDYAFTFKSIKRRNDYVVYLKRSDEISNFLAYLEASNSCLDFENIRVDRDFSNVTNRLLNCDAYNYQKSVETAKKQVEDIELLKEKIGLDSIEDLDIKSLCLLRLANREATYSELASLLSKEKERVFSKSKVSRMFKKIGEMACLYETK
jgi:DNA-binding protein WhiA